MTTLHPDYLRPMAEFVERFANLPDIEFFRDEAETPIQSVMRDLREALWESAPRACELEPYDRGDVASLYRDRDSLRTWIKRIAALGKNASSYSKDANALRAKFSAPEVLGRMQFQATLEFAARGAELRLIPVRIGVEAAMYQVLAAALERGSMVHIGQCVHVDTVKKRDLRCEQWVIHARGGTGTRAKRVRCPFHSLQAKKGSERSGK